MLSTKPALYKQYASYYTAFKIHTMTFEILDSEKSGITVTIQYIWSVHVSAHTSVKWLDAYFNVSWEMRCI